MATLQFSTKPKKYLSVCLSKWDCLQLTLRCSFSVTRVTRTVVTAAWGLLTLIALLPPHPGSWSGWWAL